MALVYLLSLLLFISLAAANENQTEFTGDFDMREGSTCKYNVIDFYDDGIVGFRVKCNCQGLNGRLTYSCVYFGKPNICPGFNETAQARYNFYTELVDHIKGIYSWSNKSREVQVCLCC